jgi:hypothetical protein
MATEDTVIVKVRREAKTAFPNPLNQEGTNFAARHFPGLS